MRVTAFLGREEERIDRKNLAVATTVLAVEHKGETGFVTVVEEYHGGSVDEMDWFASSESLAEALSDDANMAVVDVEVGSMAGNNAPFDAEATAANEACIHAARA